MFGFSVEKGMWYKEGSFTGDQCFSIKEKIWSPVPSFISVWISLVKDYRLWVWQFDNVFYQCTVCLCKNKSTQMKK